MRGEGCYLWDEEGNKYLDLLTGWGVFALGRNHPKIKSILKQLLDMDRPNLVRMDCSLLSGLAAQALIQARCTTACPAFSSPTAAPKPSKRL